MVLFISWGMAVIIIMILTIIQYFDNSMSFQNFSVHIGTTKDLTVKAYQTPSMVEIFDIPSLSGLLACSECHDLLCSQSVHLLWPNRLTKHIGLMSWSHGPVFFVLYLEGHSHSRTTLLMLGHREAPLNHLGQNYYTSPVWQNINHPSICC